jgi:hypothetical protein
MQKLDLSASRQRREPRHLRNRPNKRACVFFGTLQRTSDVAMKRRDRPPHSPKTTSETLRIFRLRLCGYIGWPVRTLNEPPHRYLQIVKI